MEETLRIFPKLILQNKTFVFLSDRVKLVKLVLYIHVYEIWARWKQSFKIIKHNLMELYSILICYYCAKRFYHMNPLNVLRDTRDCKLDNKYNILID